MASRLTSDQMAAVAKILAANGWAGVLKSERKIIHRPFEPPVWGVRWTAGTTWHADHKVAVVDGGGGTGAWNARLLCVPCHRARTAEQAANRARKVRVSTNRAIRAKYRPQK